MRKIRWDWVESPQQFLRICDADACLDTRQREKKGKAVNFPPGEFPLLHKVIYIGPGAAAETTLHQ